MNTELLVTDASSDSPGERGTECWYPTRDPVEVNLLPQGNGTFPATVIDVCRVALRLEIARPIRQHTKIEIVFPATGMVVSGEVRHCLEVDYLFNAGVLVEHVTGCRNAGAR